VKNNYYFLTRWRVKASAEEVFAIISDPLEYPRWWPAVYLETADVVAGQAGGVGRRVRLHTRGWLPYTLRWESEVTEVRRPQRLAIRATGDFNGRGIWSLVEDGEYCDVTFDWKLIAEKPLLAALSFALKPAFEANHRWAMARGEESLRLELARGRAQTPEELNGVPKPERPPSAGNAWLAGVSAAAIAAGALIAARGR
jgi:hypothetical protein